MGVIEKITRMKKEGMDDASIKNKLQEQRVPPADINDAFNQIKVKEAVSADNLPPAPKPNQRKMANEQYYTPRTRDIESPQDQGFQMEAPENTEDYYNPSPQNPQQNYPPQMPQQQSQTEQSYYPQYNYEEYPQSYGGQTNDTIIEIAEQVFEEKTKELQKQIESVNEFAKLAENRIENNSERIKRIEKIIDNLQVKILGKVGSYGDNMENIKKEMNMMQESFSKVLPELVEAKKHSKK